MGAFRVATLGKNFGVGTNLTFRPKFEPIHFLFLENCDRGNL